MCGGDRLAVLHRLPHQGRSPRVRGRPALAFTGREVGGSIPACAGETLTQTAAAALVQVDPRVCGGDLTVQENRLAMGGRSPRVRGKRPAIAPHVAVLGSIPACAGETR